MQHIICKNRSYFYIKMTFQINFCKKILDFALKENISWEVFEISLANLNSRMN